MKSTMYPVRHYYGNPNSTADGPTLLATLQSTTSWGDLTEGIWVLRLRKEHRGAEMLSAYLTCST